jgi:hypothetical protein
MPQFFNHCAGCGGVRRPFERLPEGFAECSCPADLEVEALRRMSRRLIG